MVRVTKTNKRANKYTYIRNRTKGSLLEDVFDGAHVRGGGLQRLADSFGQHHDGNLRAQRFLVSTLYTEN